MSLDFSLAAQEPSVCFVFTRGHLYVLHTMLHRVPKIFFGHCKFRQEEVKREDFSLIFFLLLGEEVVAFHC